MKKTILIYGFVVALLVVILKVLEYKYFVRNLSVEIYIGVVAVLFVSLGIWLGGKVNSGKLIHQDKELKSREINTEQVKELGISKREFEVLELISAGYSNQEIAEKLFISLSTVKTHSSNLFLKLDVKRRTQAIQKAKELNIL
ncbi:response regulator transcription factor [Flexithrix dorotheae]|uniref:response regulator transcription factor n=1 Tax=Flexithrix dorotheae TaxID=70993 RepID=UPI00036DE928|nr:LuxR C-terminal-related transcriptional regulator [Flexithrix dorotheae]